MEADRAAGRLTRAACQVMSAQGRVLNQQDLPLGELPKNLPATLLVHSHDISLMAIDVPDVKGKKSADALMFAAEPHVLSDIEDVFVSAHHLLETAGDAQRRTVAVIEKLRARDILQSAIQLGLQVRQLSCEPLFFEVRGRDAWLLDSGDTTWVCAPDSAPWPLDNTDEVQATARLGWWLAQRGADRKEALLILGRNPSVKQAWENSTGQHFEYLGRDALVQRDNPVSLLPERDMRVTGSGNWNAGTRWAGSARLGLAAAMAALLVLNLAAQRVRNAQQAMDLAIEEAFAQALPNTPMVADPVVMLERSLQQLAQNQQSGGSAFTQLLHGSALQMQALPFNSASTIAYDSNRLNLTFSVDITDSQKRDIEAALRAQQMRANWQSDDKKKTRLSVSWGNN
jgi:type II secretion system protein L